jgi:poly-gamma-glutamate capsule biosynthesis protein CapA/YwtB (metallophosphatase superfamily)
LALRVIALGDLMLGRRVGAALRHRGPRALLGDTLGLLEDADLRLANLEAPISTAGQPQALRSAPVHFRAEPRAMEVLELLRLDGCTLANNHILDYGEQALLETLAHLDQRGIAWAGAGRNLAEARAPALLPHRLALLAFTDQEPGYSATALRAGTNFQPVSVVDPKPLNVIRGAIASARARGSQWVIVTNHWGPNMVIRPQPGFREFAHAVIDAGADAYFGHSAHVFQGVESYRGKWILYDVGDFLADYAIHARLRNDWSFISRLTLDVPRAKLELFPVQLCGASVALAHGEDRERMIERQLALSAELGTHLVPVGRHLETLAL